MMPVTRNACFQTNLRVPLDFKFWHIKGVMKPSSTGFQMITYSDAQKNMFLALWSIFANLSVHRTVASPKPFWFSYFKNKDPCFALCLDVEVFLQELDYCKNIILFTRVKFVTLSWQLSLSMKTYTFLAFFNMILHCFLNSSGERITEILRFVTWFFWKFVFSIQLFKENISNKTISY